MRNEAHAVWLLAAEAYAQAETDAGLNAADALLDPAPERARPSSGRAEMDRLLPTTSKTDHRHSGSCNAELQLSSSGSMHARRMCGRHTLELLRSPIAGITRCRASPLWRG